jgi:hypothetical protein
MFYVKTLSVTNIPNRKHSPLSLDNLLDKFSRDDAIFSCCIISQFFLHFYNQSWVLDENAAEKTRRELANKGKYFSFGKNRRGNQLK